MGNLTSGLSKSSIFAQALVFSTLEETIKSYFTNFKNNQDYVFFFKEKGGVIIIQIKSSNSAFLAIIKTQKSEFCETILDNIKQKLPAIKIIRVDLKVSFK
ncbi:MAG: hypothetical protein WCK98_01410 [bacterium]